MSVDIATEIRRDLALRYTPLHQRLTMVITVQEPYVHQALSCFKDTREQAGLLARAGRDSLWVVLLQALDLRRTLGYLACVLPQSLALGVVLFFSLSASASTFWVLGSFVEESRARTEGARLSQRTGVELFLQESIQSGKVRYRLMTGVLDDQSDREALKLELMASGAPLPWAISFEAQPYLETLYARNLNGNLNGNLNISAGGHGPSESEIMVVEFQAQNLPLYSEDDQAADAALSDDLSDELSEAELAEIDAMLASFDDETLDDETFNGYALPALVDEPQPLIGGQYAVSDIKEMSSGTQTYAIAGSFEQASRATTLAARLAAHLTLQIADRASVAVVEATLDGSLFHRVMVGPLSVSEKTQVLQAVNALVDQEAWLLSGVAVLGLSNSMEDLAPDISAFNGGGDDLNGETTLGEEPVISPRRWPGEDDPYNAARLNRFVHWPVPKT